MLVLIYLKKKKFSDLLTHVENGLIRKLRLVLKFTTLKFMKFYSSFIYSFINLSNVEKAIVTSTILYRQKNLQNNTKGREPGMNPDPPV